MPWRLPWRSLPELPQAHNIAARGDSGRCPRSDLADIKKVLLEAGRSTLLFSGFSTDQDSPTIPMCPRAILKFSPGPGRFAGLIWEVTRYLEQILPRVGVCLYRLID